jgi:hypothetical protein
MVGISEKRAIWVADWCQKKLDHTSVLMQEVMEVVLGRLVLAIQAVEHVKPLWDPLFGQQQYPAACLSNYPRGFA